MAKTNKTALQFDQEKKQIVEKPIKKQKSKDAEPPRVRKFCLISYIDRTAIERFLKRASWVQHWAICTHDKDTLEDGTQKELHTHIVLYTYNAKTSSAVRKIFDRYSAELYKDSDTPPQNTLCHECIDIIAQYRYLIHLDNPEKYQYDEQQRKVDDVHYWYNLEGTQGMTDKEENTAYAIFCDLRAGTSTEDMVIRYGREYGINSRRYKDLVRDDIWERSRANSLVPKADMIKMILDASPFKQEDKDKFWMVLSYVMAEDKLDDTMQYYYKEGKKNGNY